ncbi:MAG TPA: PIN domain-containing protein [Chthonomonadaceae bacterium]|nr:PIN domain-containing protein [Chthonomonadaceae bacterium]
MGQGGRGKVPEDGIHVLILCDASPLIALVDPKQSGHAQCSAILPALSLPLLTTWPAFAEAMYLVYKTGGFPRQRLVWQFVNDGLLTFHDLTPAEQQRMQALMEKYKDTEMDLADASLVVTAETRNLHRIFTLDSDFYVYRINDTGAFEVVP